MIELRDDKLVVSFPEIHADCEMEIDFERTLRIPDDGNDYPLPPGLGSFALRHTDDFADKVPAAWAKRGGVMMPMHGAEALWLNFDAPTVADRMVSWPFALKIAAGKINAVDGEAWSEQLGEEQDYLSIPEQPWLDGFFAGEGLIRQFVAMQMGRGYTVEEQLTGAAEHGGLQVVAYPMKREEFMRRFPKIDISKLDSPDNMRMSMPCTPIGVSSPAMGLAAGGRMQQEISVDPYGPEVYDTTVTANRCFVHLCDALVWRSITGEEPAHLPPTAADYSRAGLPWFSHEQGGGIKGGAGWLDKVKSVVEMGKDKGETPLPENESMAIDHLIALGTPKNPNQVRDGEF
jgi:hypothetical protein